MRDIKFMMVVGEQGKGTESGRSVPRSSTLTVMFVVLKNISSEDGQISRLISPIGRYVDGHNVNLYSYLQM